MAFATGFTQIQLAQLEANIALGVLSIDHNGKKTTFQSTKQMLDLRDRIKAELAAATSPAPLTPPYMTRPTVFRRS